MDKETWSLDIIPKMSYFFFTKYISIFFTASEFFFFFHRLRKHTPPRLEPTHMTETPPQTNSLLKTAYSWSSSPYPAYGMACSLLATPILRPATENKSLRRYIFGKPFPSTKSSLFFALPLAYAGFMIHDGDLVDGAGFAGAWCILYSISHSKIIGSGPWSKLLFLQGLAAGSCYSLRFFRNDEKMLN